MKKIDRRSFLRRAGLATAGMVAAPYVRLEAAGNATVPSVEPIGKTKTDRDRNRMTPTDNGRALINPGMGLSTPYYSNIVAHYGSRLAPSDTLDDFPGLSTVYLRLPWAFLEPEEGRFDWEMIDTPAQRWIDKGKQVALRVTALESWMYNATPHWVFEAGAKGYEFRNGRLIEPDYDDPVFLEKVEGFVRAFAERYDDNPHVVEVNIGHYGMWGEMHTVGSTPDHGKSWGFETVKRLIDIYCKYFKKTQLYVIDDADGVYTVPTPHPTPIMDYALSKGVSMRDDSILVSRYPEHWASQELAARFWPTLPVSLECEHYGLSKIRGNWDSDLWVQAVEEYHASFMMAHWFPREMLEAERDAIDRINRRIGYRLRLNRVEWPQCIEAGERFEIAAAWSNAGVAPCYAGGYPCFTIKDKEGGIVSVLVDEGLDVKTLSVAGPEQAVPVERKVSFRVAPLFRDKGSDPASQTYYRSAPGGTHELYVSVGRKDGTPVYELPYGEHDGRKRYKIGEITLVNERPLPEILIYNDMERARKKREEREAEEAEKKK